MSSSKRPTGCRRPTERAPARPAGERAGGRGFDVWVEDSMTRVFPRARPKTGGAGRSVRLTLAGGEYQSFQIVIRPRAGHELRNVRVRVGGLSGGTEIVARNIEWHQVGYVRVDNLDYRPIEGNASLAAAAGADLPGWWPDPLLPVPRFDVAAEFAQPIWVTVWAPPGTAPGECSGAVEIAPENDRPVTIPLRAKVHGFALPRGAGNFQTAFALFDDQLRRVYGRLDESMRLEWGDFVLRHRVNPGSIYRSEPPPVSDLEHFLRGGMNAFNVIYNRKGQQADNAGDGSPQAVEKIAPFLEALKASGDGERLFDMAHYYGFDELTLDRLHHLRDEFRTVRERFGLPTFTTSHVPQEPATLRKLNVDWLCPITNWLNAEKVARCRRAGFKIWTYVSLEPDPPYANFRIDCPLIEPRVLMWQAYRQQVDGFLYWGFNAWRNEPNDRPVDPGSGPFLDWSVTSKWESRGRQMSWLHGDGVLLYPGVDGPIGSIRLANLRDGLQDYEYLHLLKERTGRPAEAIDACKPVTTGWTEYTREPGVLAAQRRRIAGRIARS